jgi:hypothetical protein
MSTTYSDAVVASDMTDINELPLDVEINIDESEYVHIMRRIGLVEGEAGTSVSAFNSSI